jgi:hypothetical protein
MTDGNVTRLPCPTCSWPSRETVGMVCQTCGTDYSTDPPTRPQDHHGWPSSALTENMDIPEAK